MKETMQALSQLEGDVIENEQLKNHTTWKIGGPASLFFEPHSIEALKQGIGIIHDEGIPWFVLGRGSNLLISDKGIDGVVIKLGEKLSDYSLEGNILRVGAGYSLIKLATIISKKGYSGLEFAAGIPGTVGGAIFMNAGAHGSDVSKILTRAHVLFPDGSMKWIENKDMAFSYRTSRLQTEKGIVIEGEFELQQGDAQVIKQELQKNKDYRRDTQPWNYPCCGSVFRNPLPRYAGQLIEESGLKGFSVGGAQVSTVHANFIVNKGDATSKDVLNLIKHIQNTIFEKYHVKMETEVEQVGNSD
ncbi:UDP-N-acetylmuramate dehydrogenase [Bacillus shivajii]|uniref:UDP-N-acetylmuramate dehydrogenase n=1 Tax=Bacillus shivajii TaxID=1983719 RepID=UPI001CFAC8E4|nr:UDP-N-acetylmuramate dehydrogenase [Bacillus shivajii]UCZ51824.1 UDP-N-acetylmuramate dehydrogenase [Bacillus shivajii]